MADCMLFPSTVEEYMEQYKIVDTEKVYTNGTELVPIFRMKQWFEHLPSAQPEPYEELDFVQEHKKIPVVLDIQQKGKSMPSAQPEIIRCKDCKWHKGQYYCANTDTYGFDGNDFCSAAERRKEGEQDG